MLCSSSTLSSRSAPPMSGSAAAASAVSASLQGQRNASSPICRSRAAYRPTPAPEEEAALTEEMVAPSLSTHARREAALVRRSSVGAAEVVPSASSPGALPPSAASLRTSVADEASAMLRG